MYKVGDVVLVRDDLVSTKVYNGVGFTSGMAPYKGKCVAISKVHLGTTYGVLHYNIKEDPFWNWTDEMFCGLATTAEVDVSEFL